MKLRAELLNCNISPDSAKARTNKVQDLMINKTWLARVYKNYLSTVQYLIYLIVFMADKKTVMAKLAKVSNYK